ncbi:MAG: phosphatase PAP2 family protein [Chloroflexi bacterium]|nr:phosphatase PAP2 family protein [Chloroflexota bacterium]
MLKTIIKEIALVGACYLIFALVKNLTDPSPVLKAVTNGWGVLRLEAALALNFESFIQQVIGRISVGALIAITYFYVAGMWLGLIGTAIFTFIKNRSVYLDLRRTFVLTMIFGAIVFAIYPLAPPRFMPGLGMTDTVTLLGLDPAPHSDSAISYNRFAAMPSLHYAWALLVMIATFKVGGAWLKAGGILFQALMFVAIIATANHYVLDALAGAILLMTALFVNRWWTRHRDQMNKWKNDQLVQLSELDHNWRRRIGTLEMPDLRQQFLSGFIIRGGHAIQPIRSKITNSHHLLPVANVQRSFRPELNNLSLILN